jgi:7-carboxy-7-deazaguanine synthase
VKFVICDRADYEWAREVCTTHRLTERVHEVLFSPSHTELPAARLADWVLADRLPVRVQIQLHKVLWGDEPGR